MLPVVDKPLIQYAVEEAINAGITEMIFVTGRSKRAIEDHFDKSYEIEAELEARGKEKLLELVRGIKPSHVNCFYVRQPEALGLGHAVLCAEKLVHGEPFAVILADDLLHGEQPVLKQLVDVFDHYHNSVIGVETIPARTAVRTASSKAANGKRTSSSCRASSRSRRRKMRRRISAWSAATCSCRRSSITCASSSRAPAAAAADRCGPVAARERAGARVSLLRHALRLRQQDRLSQGHRRLALQHPEVSREFEAYLRTCLPALAAVA